MAARSLAVEPQRGKSLSTGPCLCASSAGPLTGHGHCFRPARPACLPVCPPAVENALIVWPQRKRAPTKNIHWHDRDDNDSDDGNLNPLFYFFLFHWTVNCNKEYCQVWSAGLENQQKHSTAQSFEMRQIAKCFRITIVISFNQNWY